MSAHGQENVQYSATVADEMVQRYLSQLALN